jgi:hypothetical protein
MQVCSCCLGELKDLTKRVNKDGLILILSTKMNASNAGLSIAKVVKLLNSSKDLIFHNDDIPKTNKMGQVHTVALKMFGKGIVKLTVADKTKVATSKMTSTNISMKVCVKAVERNGKCIQCFVTGSTTTEMESMLPIVTDTYDFNN